MADKLSTAGVETFAKEVKVTFRIALDPSWSTAQAYKVVGLPTTYLIDRAGNVVVREVGERDWTDEQTYQAPHNQEYCCLFGIKRAIVDHQPDKAALIVRAFRRAKQWVAQNPAKAVIASQAAGYYPAAVPVEPSANRAVAFGYDRQVDLAQSLERAFQDRIDMGAIKTDKTAKELVRLHYRKIQ